MSKPDECASSKTGSFSWNELITTDQSASANFYGKLFGWKTEPFAPKGTPDGMAYTLFKTDSQENGVGGMAQPMHAGAPTHWVPYVVVEDIDASLATALKLGAQSIVPIAKIECVGRVAVIKDPQGATIGLHEFPK